MPKISVIVPVYNTEKYIRRCLDSILNQTFQDFEIIIINDGSTDGSEEIINEVKDKYSDKIRYFKQENQGIAVTRNLGIQKVSGDYFMFVDSDDYIEKDLLAKLNDVVVKENVDIVKYKMKILKDQSVILIDGPTFDKKNGQDAFNKLCYRDKMIDTPCLYLFNTRFYKNHNFEFLKNTYHEDFGLIPLVVIMAKTVISIDFFGYNYVQVANSIIRNEEYEKTLKKANDLLLHYDNMMSYLKKANLNKQTVNNVKQYFSNAILRAHKKLKNNDKKTYKINIRKRQLIKNMKVKNIKQILKKMLFIMGLNIY